MTSHEVRPVGPDTSAGAPTPYVYTAEGPPFGPPPESAPALEVRDVVGVLRRNAWLILLCTLVAAGGSWYLVSREVPQYRASAAIRLVDSRKELAGGITGTVLGGSGVDAVLSQIEVLRGREVMGRVVDQEGLRLVNLAGHWEPLGIRDLHVSDASRSGDTLQITFGAAGIGARSGRGKSVQAPYGASVKLDGMEFTVPAKPRADEATLVLLSRDAAIDRTIGALNARPRPNTDAVDVQFTAADPVLAQQVVNSAVDVFRDVSTVVAQTQSRRRRQFLERQLVSVDSALTGLQQQLSAFRGQHQVYNSQEKIEAQASGLTQIDVERSNLEAERQSLSDMLARLQQAQGNQQQFLRILASSPAASNSPVVSQLYVQLRGQLSARDSLTTGVLAVTAEHPAVQRVDLDVRRTREEILDAARNQLAYHDARLRTLSDLRSRYTGQVEALSTTGAGEDQLVQQLTTMNAMGDQLRTELQRARIAEAVELGQVEVINHAPLPAGPIGSGQQWKLGLGVVLGLLFGGGVAFMRESLDRSINRREDLEEVLRVPGLAVIPRLQTQGRLAQPVRGTRKRIRLLARGGGGTGAEEALSQLVSVVDARAPAAEAFRMLRTNLLFSQTSHALKMLVVTSATPGEGKTTTAANLAVAYAQQGMKVLLVDCDLRRPRVHRVFDIEAKPGLTDLLLGFSAPTEVVHTTGVDGLSVIPSGTLPPNPAELLGGPRMKRALEVLVRGFDLILLDTPPLTAASDALVLGVQSDGVVMVVRAGATDRAVVRQSIQQLRGVGARVLGAVLNDPDGQVPQYGGYYYADYYSKEA